MKDHDLLIEVYTTLKVLVTAVGDLKDGLVGKVDKVDFQKVLDDVEDLKKSKWMVLGGGAVLGAIINHLFAFFTK